MITYHRKPDCCPTCGDVHDCASNVEGKGKPGINDFIVCINCGAVNQLDEDLLFAPASKADLNTLLKNQPDAFFKMVLVSTRIQNDNKQPNK